MFSNSIPLHKRLSFRQAKNSVLVALSIGLILSTSQLIFDYFNHKSELDKNIEEILDAAKKSAVHAAYNFDKNAAEQLTRGLVSYAPIVRAEIIDEFGSQLSLSESLDQGEVSFFSRWLFESEIIFVDDLYKLDYSKKPIGEIVVVIDSTKTANIFLSRVGLTFFAAILKNVILTLALIVVFHFTLTKTILELHGVIQKGKTQQRLPKPLRHAEDELGSLISEFNDHLVIIDDQHNQILESRRNLEEQIKERTLQLENKNKELIEKREIALKANIAKSEFLAMMSHEVKTPMGAVLGIIQLLTHSSLTQEQRKHVNVIKTSCESLVKLINELLSYSKIDKNEIFLEMEPFSLFDLIKSVETLMSAQVNEKNLSLKTNITGGIKGQLIGDGGKIKQILINLISNAIKYTDEGDIAIDVKVVGRKDKNINIRFSVADSGSGIPDSHKHQVFKEFFQINQHEDSKRRGTGLGLAICQKLVELMGGELKIRDNSKTKSGSVFYFTVWLRESSDTAAQSATLKNIKQMPPLNILVVEDVCVNREVLEELLSIDGHLVISAKNGLEALNELDRHTPDVILMDIRMPVLNGFEATKRIRELEDPKKSGIPIIGVTAHFFRNELETCRLNGMNDIVHKPISLPELYTTVLKYIDFDKRYGINPLARGVKKEHYLDFDIIDRHIAGIGIQKSYQLTEKAIISCERKIEVLGKITKNGCVKSVQKESHDLSGIANNFGFIILAQISTQIEALAASQDFQSISGLITDLSRSLEVTSQLCRSYMDKTKNAAV